MNDCVCFLACNINDILNQLIIMLNGLSHKVSDNVIVLVMRTVLVLE